MINSPPSKQKAFTLIELIVVILLVSIVSVYASSRYFGTDSFSAYAAQDQVISVIRQVQLNQMQSNDTTNDNFVLTITNDCVGSVTACTTRDDGRSDWVSIEGVSFSPQFNQVSFSLLGNPSAAIAFDVIAGGNSCEVQINSQGYVERGGC